MSINHRGYKMEDKTSNSVDWGYRLCLNDCDKFKKGDICYFIEEPAEVYSLTLEGERNYSKIESRDIKNHFARLKSNIYIDLYYETLQKRILRKPKKCCSIINTLFDFIEFDKAELRRIQSEIFPYILEIKDTELLYQFSTDIEYTLNTLIELYRQKDEIDFGLEITKASIIFKEINTYCVQLQANVEEEVGNFKKDKMNNIMEVHTTHIDSTITKLRELNQDYNNK